MILQKICSLLNLSKKEIDEHPFLLINAFDRAHHIVVWNGKCETYFGIQKERALGKRLEDILPETANNPKMIYLEKALNGEEIFVPVEDYERSRGSYIQRVIPIRSDEGDVIAALNLVSNMNIDPEKRAGLWDFDESHKKSETYS